MSARRSSATSSSGASRGFTLVEVLVALGLTTIVALAVGSAYIFATKGWADHRLRLNTQQQLRSAVTALSREVRLAGACMDLGTIGTPSDFQPLAGVDNGTTDSITVRTNPRCAEAVLTSDCSACSALVVDNPANFLPGTAGYIISPDGANHEYFKIQSVAGSTITLSAALTKNYPRQTDTTPGSGVFGVEQRIFRVDSTCSGGCDGATPSLTLELLGASAETPLVPGVDRLDVHYILNRAYDAANCDAGTGGAPNLCVVNLPATGADWSQVRVVTFDLGARSIAPIRAAGPDGYLHLRETFEITPRNAVFKNRL